MQFLIRERMRGVMVPEGVKSRGALLIELGHELRELREELEEKRYESNENTQEQPKREMTQITIPTAEVPKHQQRPSLISLLTGVGVQSQHMVPSVAGIESRSSGMHTPSDTISQQNLQPPRESFSSSSTTTRENIASDSHSGESTVTNQGVNLTQIPTGAQHTVGNFNGSHGIPSHQPSWRSHPHRLRFVQSVEFKHSSGETSTTPLSPESPIDESSGETNKPSRLQRSKAQSRKTFRSRRGRQVHSDAKLQQSHSVEHPPSEPGKPSDASWDSVSQTSSTSGYRDNYSQQTSVLSPDISFSGPAPLAKAQSQQSLVIVSETKDEDTLI